MRRVSRKLPLDSLASGQAGAGTGCYVGRLLLDLRRGTLHQRITD
jgi:hypothetical protein